MTCVCYGNDSYEGCSKPLTIHPTVNDAKAWWSDQAKLHVEGQNSEGWHDYFCIAEFADDGRIFHYSRNGTSTRGSKEWRIEETKEMP